MQTIGSTFSYLLPRTLTLLAVHSCNNGLTSDQQIGNIFGAESKNKIYI